jgi:hypothetical protein
MKCVVSGIGERRSGTSKKTGKPYDFTPIYCFSTAADVVGHKAEEISFNHLSKLTFPSIAVGDEIDIQYDKNGFIVSVDIEKSGGKSNIKINTQA